MVFFDFGFNLTSQHQEIPSLIHVNIWAHGNLVLKSTCKVMKCYLGCPSDLVKTGKYGSKHPSHEEWLKNRIKHLNGEEWAK